MRLLLALLALVLATGVADAEKKPAAAKKPAEAPPGPGDKRRIIGILDVHVDGVPPDVAAKFQKSLEDQLDSREYWLAPQARMHELLGNSTKWSEGCLLGPCLMEVKVQTGADVVLLAAINGSGTSFGYVVSVVRTDTGQYVAQESERCDVCTVNEALTNATLAAVKLVTSIPDKFPDPMAEQRAALDLTTKKYEHDKVAAKSHHKRLAMIVTLTGIAVGVGGAALYFTQDHASYGLATAAAGAGIAVGGIVMSF
ncbi:MAG TPA: hypothetical protein VL326_13280 [Kofleriaceae bacterium]|nr:hypothetical protein [Kofleriaceae bacterium]